MLYCLTGRSFFRGDGIRETLTNVIRKELPPVQKLIPEQWCSDEMDQFLRKSLAKNRNKRFQSAQDMLDALNKLPLKKPDHKNPWQYADPTSQFHRGQMGKTDTRSRSSINSQAFVGVPPPTVTEPGQDKPQKQEPEQEQGTEKGFPGFLVAGLVGMSLVFGAMTWLIVKEDPAVRPAAKEGEEAEPLQPEQKKPIKVASEISGAQKEQLWMAKEAMAKQDFKKARTGFEVLVEEGVQTREVLTGMALSSFHLKEYAKAADAFKSLMKRFPKEAAKYRPFMQMATQKAGLTKE